MFKFRIIFVIAVFSFGELEDNLKMELIVAIVVI